MTEASRRRRDLPDLPPLIHQALLDPHLTPDQLQEGCDAARQLGMGGVCTSLRHLPTVRQRLGPPGTTRLIASIAFPFGALPSHLKQTEAEWAAAEGADAVDVAPDLAALAAGEANRFADELAALAGIGLPLTVILDLSRCEGESLQLAVEAAIDAGAAAMQSGHGFSGPATPEQITRLRSLCRGRCGIKAVGGVHRLDHCIALVEAGATAIGTSHGPSLLQELRRPQSHDARGD
jgi:deoxyribose-phosphate aldolase